MIVGAGAVLPDYHPAGRQAAAALVVGADAIGMACPRSSRSSMVVLPLFWVWMPLPFEPTVSSPVDRFLEDWVRVTVPPPVALTRRESNKKLLLVLYETVWEPAMMVTADKIAGQRLPKGRAPVVGVGPQIIADWCGPILDSGLSRLSHQDHQQGRQGNEGFPGKSLFNRELHGQFSFSPCGTGLKGKGLQVAKPGAGD